MDEMRKLGRNLKRLRLSRVLTQAELGLKVGLTKETISLLELGKRDNVGVKYLIRICQALGADLEYLFARDARTIRVDFNVSDGSVRALGEIVRQAQKILAKRD